MFITTEDYSSSIVEYRNLYSTCFNCFFNCVSCSVFKDIIAPLYNETKSSGFSSLSLFRTFSKISTFFISHFTIASSIASNLRFLPRFLRPKTSSSSTINSSLYMEDVEGVGVDGLDDDGVRGVDGLEVPGVGMEFVEIDSDSESKE